MKTPLAITLIIVGAVLILAPVAADQLHESRVANVISRPGITSVRLGEPLSETYRLGCWLTGSAMIALAVWFSTGERKHETAACGAIQTA